ncbi:class I SAM-dependent methyltransferase [Desulfomonile tiedjei]|uniref:Methyltransferase family protein n=1 Tax=Desulfomonile tiedjei (strain ATCC 49306 / DSM 6799 / DCB-1) TaxID=706587 RepID=I4CDD9_DESTA|nr:methyltransferase domain-containing protein [Desulfomonile tiedjei]AFM27580.1 methyltransferase family protein [Desulfomonile tiedjei DSM 6799]
MQRYGKPSLPLLKHKRNFFEENDEILAEQKRVLKLYAAQPRRSQCKNCHCKLQEIAFSKLGIDYLICPNCGHLNGGHEDTDAFVAQLYINADSKSLASVYRVEDIEAYQRRVADIYLPKIDFLIEALREEGLSPLDLSYADLGAGSGYLVQAFLSRGAEKAIGYEVSLSQVAFANAMIPGERIRLHSLDEISEIAKALCADVVTLIGVLQHLRHPELLLRSLQENANVRYLYFSVPIFSPCIFFEMVFSSVMQRQLSGGHTHLYTESSIDWFCNKFGFKRVAEWWFGTDMFDLYRSIGVSLRQAPETGSMCERWWEIMKSAIDEMQLALDRRRLSSEVHMLVKLKR